MSAITLAQARAQRDALLASQAAGSLQSISIHGRTVTYASAAEFQEQLNWWIRVVSELERVASGRNRHGVSHADFRTRR